MNLSEQVSFLDHMVGDKIGTVAQTLSSIDWDRHLLGKPEHWPLTLKTTINILLNLPSPALLTWGKESTCFYNQPFNDIFISRDASFIGQNAETVIPGYQRFINDVDHLSTANVSDASGVETQLDSNVFSGFFKNAKITRLTNDHQEYGGLLMVAQVFEDDIVSGATSVDHDLREQIETQKRIQESEQRVRSLMESAPFPIGLYIGKEMRIELVNQSILDVWGKGNDVIGKTYSEVLPELADTGIYDQLDLVYTTGVAFHARNQRVDLVVDGKLQPFYFNYSFTPVFDAEGNVYGVMNTAAEITDLVNAQQKLAQSEENLRNMVLQAPVAMCIMLGPDHVVEVANELMIELWGKPRENVIKKPIFEGLPDAKEQGLEALLSNVYATGQTFRANEMPVNLLRNGKTETVYQNFVYEPYRDSNGAILGVLAITVDVTEQVKARRKIEEVVAQRTRELETANHNLQRSNADLAQFAYIASHDLQEPVRKVSTFAEMLETTIGHGDERVSLYLDKIKSSASRMRLLISDVLAYSAIDKGSEGYTFTNLQQIVEDVVQDFELLIEQKNAKVIIDGLPAIQAIPTHMSQLFANLISNALKFVKTETPPVVKVSNATVNEADLKLIPQYDPHIQYYKIEVSDNGIGFPQEYAKNIFNIFQRLHTRKEYEGTGIGLALCLKIVLNHHGAIYALSEEGKGATFVLLLPKTQSIS